MPFLWYFYSAIPRGVAFSVFLIPFGMVYDIRITRLIIPTFVFVIIYSILPHKELRFIIYIFPVLNVSVASYCNRIWQTRFKPKGFQNLFALAYCAGHIIGNLAFTILLLSTAIKNYPGGHAMALLHQSEKINLETNYTIHIDNLAAQTGVTRFTQLSNHWLYSKKENLNPGCEELMAFTHLIVESNNRDNEEMMPYRQTHSILSIVPGFSHITFNYNKFPPVKIKTKTQLFVLKKKINKPGVKQNIKRIVEEYKNEPVSEKKTDLNLDLLSTHSKKIKQKETDK